MNDIDRSFILDRLNKLSARLTALETRPCSPDSSASPAAASVGSAGTTGDHFRSTGSTSTGASTAGVSSPSASDPTAAIRADPRRPGECPGCGSAIECELDTWWCTKWSCKYHERWSIPRENWPHVPQPAPADLESILGTASAAKAVEQGVADVLEGRTVRLPNPVCPECKDNPSCGDGSWRWAGKWWEHRCRDVDPQAGHWAVITPTPRRTAREVAREAADKLYAYNGQGWEFAAQVIQAAIERDREGR